MTWQAKNKKSSGMTYLFTAKIENMIDPETMTNLNN